VFLALKKRKKHALENLRCDYTFFVLDEFVQLLPEVIEDAQIEIQSVDLFDYPDPILALTLFQKS
jgi:hypothetical protein